MALVVLGKKHYSFTNKEGQLVQGLKLHCMQQFPSPTEGQLTELIGVGSNKPIYPMADTIPYGSVITPVYNKYGSVDDIVLVTLPGDIDPATGNKKETK